MLHGKLHDLQLGVLHSVLHGVLHGVPKCLPQNSLDLSIIVGAGIEMAGIRGSSLYASNNNDGAGADAVKWGEPAAAQKRCAEGTTTRGVQTSHFL